MNTVLNEMKDEIGYSLIGEYLKGAGFTGKGVKSADLGKMVCGESFVPSSGRPLVSLDKFDSPAVSCGVLSSLIEACNRKLDTQAEKRLMNTLGYGEHDRKEAILRTYANDLFQASAHTAYGEGADDDDLKQDIRVLLRESKEEFEKRVQENEEDKKAEEQDTLSDDSLESEGGDPVDDGLEPENNDNFQDGDGIEDNLEDDIDDDLEEGEDEEEEEGEDIPSGELEDGEDDHIDSGFEDEEDEDEEEDGKGESAPFVPTPEAIAMLNDYNATRRFAEEQKFFVGGEFCSISKGEMEGMVNTLLEIERDNFKAIGESFNLDDITSTSKISMAHKDYINTMAGVIAFRHKLFQL